MRLIFYSLHLKYFLLICVCTENIPNILIVSSLKMSYGYPKLSVPLMWYYLKRKIVIKLYNIFFEFARKLQQYLKGANSLKKHKMSNYVSILEFSALYFLLCIEICKIRVFHKLRVCLSNKYTTITIFCKYLFEKLIVIK